jgi:hypothetical protein
MTPESAEWRLRPGVWLAGILLAGLALRAWGIAFGLPWVDARPDERNLIIRAITLVSEGPNPHYFNYPSGFFYLLAGLFTAQGTLAVWLGKAESLTAYLAGFYLDPTALVLTARLVSVAASTATVLAIYWFATRLADRRAGLLAAAAASVAFLAVRDAHFGVIDSVLTLLITLAVGAMLRASRERSRRAGLTAGVLVGLAVGTKYGAVLLVVPLALAFLLRDDGSGRIRWHPEPAKLGAAVLAAVLVFLVTTPFAVLDGATFWRDFTFEMDHLARGHAVVGDRGWWTHATVNLRYGLGLPLALAAGIGLVLRLVRPSAGDLVGFAFPLVYYLAIGRGYTNFARYMLPVVPFACVAAAMAVDRVAAAVPRLGRSRRRLAVSMLGLGLLATPSIVRSVHFDVLLTRADTRELLASWWLRNLPRGTEVGWFGDPWGIPLLYDPIDEPSLRGWLPPAAPWREPVVRLRRDREPPRYPVRWLGNRPDEILRRLVRWRPAWMVVETGPLAGYTIPEVAVPSLVPEDRYERVFCVDPYRRNETDAVYDQYDAFFLPLAGLDSVSRPGPALTVYRRRDAGGGGK